MKRIDLHLEMLFIWILVIPVLFSVSPLHAGSGWSVVSPPNVSSDWTLYGVYFTSEDEGWAVGSDFHNRKGVVLHYSSGTWSSVDTPSVSSAWELFSVHFISPTEGWAVGRDNSNHNGVLLRYSNGSWTSISLSRATAPWQLNSVYFTSATEGWAVGEDNFVSSSNRGVLLHFSNSSWSEVAPPYVSSSWTLNDVHFTSPGEGWAVGDDKTFQGGGVLLHFANGLWVSMKPPNAGRDWDLQGVQLTSSDEGWAVGNDYEYPVDTGLFLHYTSGTWTPSKPTRAGFGWSLLDTHFTSSTEGWAVGIDLPTNSIQTGLLVHFSDGSWSFVSPPAVGGDWGLSGVHFVSSDEGWAVGGDNVNQRGVILHFLNLPDIAVIPSPVDFGSVIEGRTLKKTILVRNVGTLDLTLGPIGTPADTVFTRTGGSCTNGEVLIPEGQCTIVVQFAPVVSGLFTSTFDIHSNDPDEAIVTVDLQGRSGPADLTGSWQSLAEVCGVRCNLTGILQVENLGYKEIPSRPSSFIFFYLSDDNVYTPGLDRFLKRIAVGTRTYSSSKNILFKYRFPSGQSGSGKYVIAVIDGNNKITESDDTNNIAVSDVIP